MDVCVVFLRFIIFAETKKGRGREATDVDAAGANARGKQPFAAKHFYFATLTGEGGMFGLGAQPPP
ncbi:hypothetical protein M2103_000741 [Ereboglobus sp. PH5-5]|uniref:hypothetical protein n=1 Tax=Ereboglobus sp. PH5-5 TaxID=2940529 RepID=UPI0024063685|nr:hypothetical protein [Ereboglobus sp. PH5-5]MDF9832531.1 hypothetical protein [Ereboglobus sp. PH5-5]